MKRFSIILVFVLFPILNFAQEIKSTEIKNDRVVFQVGGNQLHIIPLSTNAARINYGEDFSDQKEALILTEEYAIPEFRFQEEDGEFKVILAEMTVHINKENGALSYSNGNGEVFLSEEPGTRFFKAEPVMGEEAFIVGQTFDSPDGEFIFGLGQFQDGHYNLKGKTRKLTQVNSQIAIPIIYSTRGYGLLWHQYGMTEFNPADNFITLEKQELKNEDGEQLADVTTTSGTQRISQGQAYYKGSFNLPQDTEYSIMLDLGGMGNRHFVAIDGRPVIDQENIWLPPTQSATISLMAGEHEIEVISRADNNPKVSWNNVENTSVFRSTAAKLLDYVVFYGPSTDKVISTYRDLSGNAPMLPIWAYGFWQCRERYTSSVELIETVKEFRDRKLPMDVIVQDWQYWGDRGWGVPQFDTNRYPNPSEFIEDIHDLEAHFAISIWSNPDKNSELGQYYVENDLFIPDTKWLDYFNPETSESYWNTLKVNMFDHGVDAWWMDAVEPENDALTGTMTHKGPGDFYRLTYPLYVSKSVYDGQRETSEEKRVTILTRSAFAGQQRYGSINWSGDINGTWDGYRRQIVSGMNYAFTGIPNWTTDIGGFFRPGGAQYTDENYRELLTRWFQWGAFNTIFRIHGYQSETEVWKFGKEVEENSRTMLNLRYRLIPYIYSEAWEVSSEGASMMRPMAMDFRTDAQAVSQEFQYMFGKSFLVAPITEPGITKWNVYLPEETRWYDFWTGESYEGGTTVAADAPISKIPLFVKAGSVIPMGEFIQYTNQKPEYTLEIRVYTGADGSFKLYEDEGDNYNYEDGAFAEIRFSWDDDSSTLIIGERKGSFPGMLRERTFNVVVVSEEQGVGIPQSETYDATIFYDGSEVTVSVN